jgi:nitronate monooxygenase
MTTRLTNLLNIKYPIIQAPIGSATTPELASAVSNSGGLGTLALSWERP